MARALTLIHDRACACHAVFKQHSSSEDPHASRVHPDNGPTAMNDGGGAMRYVQRIPYDSSRGQKAGGLRRLEGLDDVAAGHR
jgi:hypothetical protein